MQSVGMEFGLPIEMPDSINEPAAIDLLKELDADLFVVCDYGQILSADALGQAKLGGINLHASLLPKYRGAAPINWAVYDGCEETGVTVIHMTRKLDAGPNLIQRSVTIGKTEDAVELEERLSVLGVDAINESISMLQAWDGESAIGEKQNPSAATKAPRLKKTDGNIDWTRSAQQIVDQLRAFQPWPGIYTHWLRPEGEPLRVVLKSVAVDINDGETVADIPAGTVSSVDDKFCIATSDGSLRIESIQPAGKKAQPWDAFLRGYRVAVGEKFGTA